MAPVALLADDGSGTPAATPPSPPVWRSNLSQSVLEVLARLWKDHPYSSRSPIPRALSLDCEAMVSLGTLCIPSMEPLVTAHLHPKLSEMSSKSPRLPANSGCFQSVLTERTYGATTLSARALK